MNKVFSRNGGISTYLLEFEGINCDIIDFNQLVAHDSAYLQLKELRQVNSYVYVSSPLSPAYNENILYLF